MCNFFSFVSDGTGRFMYFDWALRAKCLSGEINYNPDSHTSIADYHGYNGILEDDLNKYEYNPLTQEFTIDQINTTDDSAAAEAWVCALDFKTVVPALIIKPIVDTRSIRKHKPTEQDIADLREWASAPDSVRASVWALVWDSVWAYVSSFFAIKYKHDFSPCVRLWGRGLVPSFDGTTWRLHSGRKMAVVHEWNP
jgi:hypothetical protein